MPGIAGLIGNIGREEGLRRVREMLKSMMHEPFYTTGVYSNEQLGLYAGWVVHPNSFCDCMPVKSADGRTILLLDGEVFNATERSGISGGFDASYLAQLYEERGEAFFEELNGTFSGVMLNSATRTVRLFNDRIGFQKTYYFEDSQGLFYFSSEAKSLLRVIPTTREFDREGLSQFLGYGCTFGDKTLYKGVSLMPAASAWEFHPNTPVKKKTYFRPSDWKTDKPVDPQTFYEQFTETFRRVVPRYFQGPLTAVSLTGGWDTRMILASLRAGPGEHPCYTFGGLSGETVDVRLARKIAKIAGQDHTVLNIQPDFLSDFGKHAQETVHVSDGYSDVCLTHELYLNRMARKITQARVTGNFGSEILRGMNTFKPLGLDPVYLRDFRNDIESAKEQWISDGETNRAAFAIFKEIPWKLTAVSRLAKSQLSLRSPFLDNEVLKLACLYPALVGSDSDVAGSLARHEYPELLGIPTDRGQSGSGGSLICAFRRLFYMATFKIDYMLNEGTPDYVSILSDAVSADYVLPVRHKFLEYRRWFRGPLRGYVEDILGGDHTFVSGLFGRKAVEQTLRNNASGLRNEMVEINALLTLELIDRCLLRQPYEINHDAVAEIAVTDGSC
jgi:asparagine synthase (glutamine-hydrolysing)